MLKVSDLVSGLAIASLGLYILLKARALPSLGMPAVSPSFYPGLLGALIMLCGLGIAGSSLWRGTARPAVTRPSWLDRPERILAVISVPAAILIYALVSERLGFIATCFLVTAGLLLCFRAPLLRSALVALVLSFALHVVFVQLMRVPLPSGIIEAWLR